MAQNPDLFLEVWIGAHQRGGLHKSGATASAQLRALTAQYVTVIQAAISLAGLQHGPPVVDLHYTAPDIREGSELFRKAADAAIGSVFSPKYAEKLEVSWLPDSCQIDFSRIFRK